MDKQMRALIDAPLADPIRTYAPFGKRPAPRSPKIEYDDIGCPKITAKELSARKKKATNDKLAALFDYYAGTDLSYEKIAEYMGLYLTEQIGEDEDGKPIMGRVRDLKRVEAEMKWRRAA